MSEAEGRRRGAVAAWWGVLGVLVLLLDGLVALGRQGAATLSEGLTPFQWIALVALTAVFLYGEGVRAIGRRWVPSVVSRAKRLRSAPRPIEVALAPLYALALIGGTRRQVVFAWAGVAAIVGAVVVVRMFPEPWRGITDFAVAAALAWGAGALVVEAVRRL